LIQVNPFPVVAGKYKHGYRLEAGRTGEEAMVSTKAVSLLAVPLMLAVHAGAEEAASLRDAVTSGRPILNLRPRYEFVEQAGRPEDGQALTMRTLAGWRTKPWKDLGVTAEMIVVSRASDDYNDGQNGKNQYPVIADPNDTDVNQLFVDYTGIASTLVRAGRQSIKLDNVRFIGNVEFRQVMQVFNGVTAENTSLPNTRIYLGYLGRLKTVNTRQHETDTIVANVRYALSPSESLVGFGYSRTSPTQSPHPDFPRLHQLTPRTGSWACAWTAPAFWGRIGRSSTRLNMPIRRTMRMGTAASTRITCARASAGNGARGMPASIASC
jgi:hypothetical protein